jgi:hypothetical protein
VFIVFLHPCHAINPRREIAGRIELTAIVAKGASKMGHLNRACAECDEWVVSRGPLREPAPDRRSRAEGRDSRTGLSPKGPGWPTYPIGVRGHRPPNPAFRRVRHVSPFVFRLKAPRPTFTLDMTDEEHGIMARRTHMAPRARRPHANGQG